MIITVFKVGVVKCVVKFESSLKKANYVEVSHSIK